MWNRFTWVIVDSDALRKARRERNIAAKELSFIVGMPSGFVTSLENDNIRCTKHEPIMRMERLLGTKLIKEFTTRRAASSKVKIRKSAPVSNIVASKASELTPKSAEVSEINSYFHRTLLCEIAGLLTAVVENIEERINIIDGKIKE